jgi:signal transduction histidine kinase
MVRWFALRRDAKAVESARRSPHPKRSMLWLPAISIGEYSVRLPIGGADALELIAILASEPDAGRKQSWTRLLRSSPTLLIWAATHIPARNGFGPFVQELLDRRREILGWLSVPGTPGPESRLDDDWVDQVADFVVALAHVRPVTKPRGAAVSLKVYTGAPANSPPEVDLPVEAESGPFRCADQSVLLSKLARIARPFWPGPDNALHRWLSDAVSELLLHADPATAPTSKPLTFAQLTTRWRTPMDAAIPSVLSDVARQVDRAGREADAWAQEKLESLRQLAYGASHEINNPLANIATRAQLLVAGEKDDKRRQQLQTIYRQAMRAHEMICDMMLFAHPPDPIRAPVDLNELVNKTIVYFEPLVSQAGWKIRGETHARPLVVSADAGQIESILAALIQNALESRDQGNIRVRCVDSAEGLAAIEMSDNGPGVSPEVARHMFDPFYSGREAGRGLGFGLSKAWTIARIHRGDLRLIETSPQGSTFRLELPRA